MLTTSFSAKPTPDLCLGKPRELDLSIFGVFWVSGGFRPLKVASGTVERGSR